MAQTHPAPNLHLPGPLVLVGMMGAGKTTIGRRLAQLLDMPFVDADDEIATAAGGSIQNVFLFHGEDMFRDLEMRVIERLLKTPHRIIATGGGAFIQDSVRTMIQSQGVSIWLKADSDVIYERVARRTTRPILEQGDKRTIVNNLVKQRYPIYQQAHITIESDQQGHHIVVQKIVDALNARYGAS